jgi:hypothetical protein
MLCCRFDRRFSLYTSLTRWLQSIYLRRWVKTKRHNFHADFSTALHRDILKNCKLKESGQIKNGWAILQISWEYWVHVFVDWRSEEEWITKHWFSAATNGSSIHRNFQRHKFQKTSQIRQHFDTNPVVQFPSNHFNTFRSITKWQIIVKALSQNFWNVYKRSRENNQKWRTRKKQTPLLTTVAGDGWR